MRLGLNPQPVLAEATQGGDRPSLALRLATLFLAVGAGALAVLGFAPFSYFVLPVLALALLAELTTRLPPRHAFLAGWDFGLGLLGFGIAWIRISLNQFGNLDAPLAWLLTILFVVAMALYVGLVGWLMARLPAKGSWIRLALVFPSVWVLVEWLRGWLFTGFPWLAMGYSQIDAPLAGFAPILGVYGVSWLAACSAGLLVLGYRLRGWRRALPLAVLLGLWAGGQALRAVSWAEPQGEPLSVSLIQGNIPQSIKWDPDTRLSTLAAYLGLTQEAWDSDLILWPETAIPDFRHRVEEELLRPLAEKAAIAGAELITGVPVLERETGRYYNAILSLGSAEDLYYKRHLVPFGEFMPFKDWLGPLVELFEVPMSDFSSGTAPRPLLRVGADGVGASVCYEDAFPEALIQALPEAAYLVNLSNDGWFGDSLAPHQHLEIARMRALETGRYLLRATNTGISAIIGPDGAVRESLGLDRRGLVRGSIQRLSGATPFVHWGSWPALIGSLLILLLAVLRQRQVTGGDT